MLGSTPFRYLDNEFTAVVHFHHLNRPLLTFPFFNERYNWKVMIVIFCNQIRHENGFEFAIAENSLIAKLLPGSYWHQNFHMQLLWTFMKDK